MAITKKNRFEVFKRDNFQCQYCGRDSPEIVLEIDHIEPKSKGGTDDIFNLITSCYDCNRGKRYTKLTDKNEIKKQKEELKKLNKRKEQLGLLLKWRNEISGVIEEEISAIENIFKESTGCSFNPPGRKIIKKLIEQYSFEKVIKATDKSISSYYKPTIPKSSNKAFDYIGRICNAEHMIEKQPGLKDLYYIRGIIRNRFHYINESEALSLLKQLHYEYNTSIETLKEVALAAKNWTYFKTGLEDEITRCKSIMGGKNEI
jgi:hypothetical protein